MDKRILFVIISIFIIGLFLFLTLQFFSNEVISQGIILKDYTIKKEIVIGLERNEKYTFFTEEPIKVFLIIPESIVNSDGEIKFGDKKANELIKGRSYSLEINSNEDFFEFFSQTTEREHTSIIIPITMRNYLSLNDEQRAQLDTAILKLGSLDESNFEIEYSKQIMNEFAQNLMSVGLEKKETKKVFFQTTDFEFQKIMSALNGVNFKQIPECGIACLTTPKPIGLYEKYEFVVSTLQNQINFAEGPLIISLEPRIETNQNAFLKIDNLEGINVFNILVDISGKQTFAFDGIVNEKYISEGEYIIYLKRDGQVISNYEQITVSKEESFEIPIKQLKALHPMPKIVNVGLTKQYPDNNASYVVLLDESFEDNGKAPRPIIEFNNENIEVNIEFENAYFYDAIKMFNSLSQADEKSRDLFNYLVAYNISEKENILFRNAELLENKFDSETIRDNLEKGIIFKKPILMKINVTSKGLNFDEEKNFVGKIKLVSSITEQKEIELSINVTKPGLVISSNEEKMGIVTKKIAQEKGWFFESVENILDKHENYEKIDEMSLLKTFGSDEADLLKLEYSVAGSFAMRFTNEDESTERYFMPFDLFLSPDYRYAFRFKEIRDKNTYYEFAVIPEELSKEIKDGIKNHTIKLDEGETTTIEGISFRKFFSYYFKKGDNAEIDPGLIVTLPNYSCYYNNLFCLALEQPAEGPDKYKYILHMDIFNFDSLTKVEELEFKEIDVTNAGKIREIIKNDLADNTLYLPGALTGDIKIQFSLGKTRQNIQVFHTDPYSDRTYTDQIVPKMISLNKEKITLEYGERILDFDLCSKEKQFCVHSIKSGSENKNEILIKIGEDLAKIKTFSKSNVNDEYISGETSINNGDKIFNFYTDTLQSGIYELMINPKIEYYRFKGEEPIQVINFGNLNLERGKAYPRGDINLTFVNYSEAARDVSLEINGLSVSVPFNGGGRFLNENWQVNTQNVFIDPSIVKIKIKSQKLERTLKEETEINLFEGKKLFKDGLEIEIKKIDRLGTVEAKIDFLYDNYSYEGKISGNMWGSKLFSSFSGRYDIEQTYSHCNEEGCFAKIIIQEYAVTSSEEKEEIIELKGQQKLNKNGQEIYAVNVSEDKIVLFAIKDPTHNIGYLTQNGKLQSIGMSLEVLETKKSVFRGNVVFAQGSQIGIEKKVSNQKEKIKELVEKYYKENNINYVLFIGGTENIPIFEAQDYTLQGLRVLDFFNYSKVDNKIFVSPGRIPFSDPKKVMDYYQDLQYNREFKNNYNLVYPDKRGVILTENALTNLLLSGIFPTINLNGIEPEFNLSEVVEEFDGKDFVVEFAKDKEEFNEFLKQADYFSFDTHGYPTVFAINNKEKEDVDLYSYENIPKLENRPVMFGLSCSTGSFLGRSFLEKGATTYLGSIIPMIEVRFPLEGKKNISIGDFFRENFIKMADTRGTKNLEQIVLYGDPSVRAPVLSTLGETKIVHENKKITLTIPQIIPRQIENEILPFGKNNLRALLLLTSEESRKILEKEYTEKTITIDSSKEKDVNIIIIKSDRNFENFLVITDSSGNLFDMKGYYVSEKIKKTKLLDSKDYIVIVKNDPVPIRYREYSNSLEILDKILNVPFEGSSIDKISATKKYLINGKEIPSKTNINNGNLREYLDITYEDYLELLPYHPLKNGFQIILEYE